MMRALVTGATGFIGSHLTEALVESGWTVVAVCRRAVRSRVEGITVTMAELGRPETLARAVREAGPLDAVFHLAARLPGAEDARDSAAFLAENGVATAALLEAAARSGCNRFVYASSIGIVGVPKGEPIGEDHPVTIRHAYFLGKYAGELCCHISPPGLVAVAMRIASPYGPGMAENTVLSQWIGQAMQGSPLELWGNGTRAQDFVHVSDVVRGLRLAAANADQGVFNLGSGVATTMGDLAQSVRAATGRRVEIRSADRADPEDGARWRLDLAKTQARLGYSPEVSLPDGLADYVAWKRDERYWRPWWAH